MTNAQAKDIKTDNTIQFPHGGQSYYLTEEQLQAMIQAAVNSATKKQAAPKARNNSAYTSKGIIKPRAAEPLYSPEQFQALGEHLLKNKHGKRDYMMLVLGCTIGCRGGDLCNTRIRDVLTPNGAVKAYYEIYEEKTGKYNRSKITEQAREAISDYIESLNGNYTMDDYLIKSQRGGKLDRSQVYRILNKAAAEIGLPQNIGTHTMRKTYGYTARNAVGNDSVMDVLQTKYNHSSQATTKRYLTITQGEVDKLSDTVTSFLYK